MASAATLTVYLVPVFEGRLAVFDVSAAAARGRWLPWTMLDFRQNPYVVASTLADEWCDVALVSLEVVDVMSFPAEGDGWEVAVVFRAELSEPPKGDGERQPVLLEGGHLDAIGPFDPVDLERWVTRGGQSAAAGARAGLIF